MIFPAFFVFKLFSFNTLISCFASTGTKTKAGPSVTDLRFTHKTRTEDHEVSIAVTGSSTIDRTIEENRRN